LKQLDYNNTLHNNQRLILIHYKRPAFMRKEYPSVTNISKRFELKNIRSDSA